MTGEVIPFPAKEHYATLRFRMLVDEMYEDPDVGNGDILQAAASLMCDVLTNIACRDCRVAAKKDLDNILPAMLDDAMQQAAKTFDAPAERIPDLPA